MKTLTMDGLQLYQNRNEYTVSIAASMTNMPKVEELEDLKELQEPFFEVTELSKIPNGEGILKKIKIAYKVPMTAKSLLSIKKSNEILKLAVLNEVLKDNLLMKQSQYMPLIHPANIYLLDMRTVRYLYVDNGELYRNPRPALEQYKALAVSMLTKYSYEKMCNQAVRQEVLQKAGNMFLISLEKCETVEQMQEMIESRLNKAESNHFLYNDKKDSAKRKKTELLLTVLSICSVISLILLAVILFVK